MSLHPCFRRRWLDIQCFSVVAQATAKIRPSQPKGYFQTKELDRTTEAFAQMNVVWEGPVCWVRCANMWQDCSLTAVQGKTACVEQSWWPEFHLFGSMPWCWFPWATSSSEVWHKRIVIKSTDAYSLNSKFDRWVYILVFAEGDCCSLPRKAFPRQ